MVRQLPFPIQDARLTRVDPPRRDAVTVVVYPDGFAIDCERLLPMECSALHVRGAQ